MNVARKSWANAMQVDFGRTAGDYARFRAGFPERLFDELATRGVEFAGRRVLDLGTGTGTLARGFSRRGAAVVALDPAEALLAEARRLAGAEELAVEFLAGRAEATELPDVAFDLVAAGQCWHWFDRPAAAAEAWRLLKPGGRLVICHFDWIPSGENMVAATETLIEQHNPDWRWGGGNGLYPAWLGDATAAGFVELQTFSHDLHVPYSHEAWRGRIRASAGVGGSLPTEQVARFDAELAALLAERFPQTPLAVPHRLFVLVADKP
jgi:ubiquinone/menaquinone biosynthesis C-methylase UbiE